jgi:hypothetical protein
MFRRPVPALEQHSGAAGQALEFYRGGLRFRRVYDAPAEKRFCFGDVGRQQPAAREDLLAYERDAVGVDELRAGRGEHHGVADDRAAAARGKRGGNLADDVRRAERAEFDGIGADVIAKRPERLTHAPPARQLDVMHAQRVLSGQRRNDGAAVHAKGMEGEKVGLDASAAARVGPRNRPRHRGARRPGRGARQRACDQHSRRHRAYFKIWDWV